MKNTKRIVHCVCGKKFYKVRSDMVVCPACQRDASARLLEASRKLSTQDVAFAEFVARLQKALEPFLGRPETAPIVSAVLGEFGAEQARKSA